jgi:hypothetical protein
LKEFNPEQRQHQSEMPEWMFASQSVSVDICFDSPMQLMGFLGLVSSEHTAGPRRRQGAITQTGNGHARRMIVESAWSYRFPARQTRRLKGKACNTPEGGQADCLESPETAVRALPHPRRGG